MHKINQKRKKVPRYYYKLKENEKELLQEAIDSKIKQKEDDKNLSMLFSSQEDRKEQITKKVMEELKILEQIKFDGYLYLLYSIKHHNESMNFPIHFFGSIQNSLLAYILDITDDFTLRNFHNFKAFTPFEEVPMIHIVSGTNVDIFENIESMCKNRALKVTTDYKSIIEFDEPLKFNILTYDNSEKNYLDKKRALELGLETIDANLNHSSTLSQFTQDGKVLLGLFCLNIGTVAFRDIYEERQKGYFKDFEDFKKRMISKRISPELIENVKQYGCFKINEKYCKL